MDSGSPATQATEARTQTEAEAKLEKLHSILTDMGRVAVAFSGGVDSTFLLATARDILKSENVLAVNAVSPVYPQREQKFALEFAARLGVECVPVPTRELGDERFAVNTHERCFHCKTELFGRLKDVAAEKGFTAIADGTTVSDLDDFRPGMRARAAFGVRSPLVEARMTKEEIRVLSRGMGLPTWDKPAMACLASRFPYGTSITVEALRRIEKAEEYLFDRGFRQVRVRHHEQVARIEVLADQMARLLDEAPSVVKHLKGLGYRYVTLDLQGYRAGSMNEVGSIPLRPAQ